MAAQAPDELHVVFYEALVADPVSTLAALTSWLGEPVTRATLGDAVREARPTVAAYRARHLSGFATRFPPDTIYGRIQANRGGPYWPELFDASARRFFHERGGTHGLLGFGYVEDDEWWREPQR
jgi:hypothetical protein